jgi:outer membrane receptor protein involved in Fe transport
MKTDTRSLKHALFTGCAIFALSGVATAAHAADAPAAADAAPATTAEIPSGEIVVTATRRSESIQNVPMTLQAFGGDALGKLNVTTFSDLLKYTPNVTFASNGPGQGQIFMRGLATGSAGNQSSGTIAPFPNVALYLDDQSMQFPARNADVYVADLERVEVLEGPQGTLFGGGAEAGAVRYITNKPKLDKFEGHMEGSFGGTAGGAPNGAFNATINVPVIQDKLAIRATIYDDHHGGYIDNVYSTFTRSATDTGSVAYHYTPSATNQSDNGQYNNASQVKNNYNPVDYTGGRIEALWDIVPDWNLLVAESYQKVDAEGTFASYPNGSDGQALGNLQTTTFSPSYNVDTYWNTAWTLNGKIGDFKLVYTGSYMTRHINEQQDYSNYSRTPGGMYYQCSGSATGFGKGSTYCYSPVANWNDQIRNTHHSEELRIQSPEGKRIRGIVGAYYENYKIYDIQRFNYTSIPGCTAAQISANQACVGQVSTYPGATANQPGLEPVGTTFGEDTQRGYRQVAFFGSVDFDILPNLTLTGGTRYYNYKEYELGSQFETYTSCYQVLACPVTGGGNHSIDGDNDHTTYHGFKSKAELTWKVADHTMVYGVFSQGFRPGGFNRRGYYILPDQNGVGQYFRPLVYNPDKLTNWEGGIKTDLFDRKVQFNLSGYYMIWNNPPIGVFNPAGGYGNTSFVTNGPSYHIKGAEAQLVARPIAGLSVQGGITYNDSKQSSAPLLPVNNPASVNFGQQLTYYYTAAGKQNVLSPFGTIGSITPFSPHVQASLRGRYDWSTSETMAWYVSSGVSYIGGMYTEPSTYPTISGTTTPGSTVYRFYLPAYATVDAQIGFKRDNWTVSVFGENLTNTHASTYTSTAQFIKSEVPTRPLTYGMKIGTSF